ncbi:MAG: hypothetical protein JWM48_595 [Mycobacterium sp.]|nr:hypothetical protein [Mycobacterium sp.]
MSVVELSTDRRPVSLADVLAELPLLISVPRAAALLGISRSAAYRFAEVGDLPVRRLGRRVYVVTRRLGDLVGEDL